MDKSIVISSVAFKFIERLAVKGIGLVISVILARLLAPEVFGLVAIITVFVNLAQTFVHSGLGTALVRSRTADDRDYSTVFYLTTAIAILMIGILFVAAPFVGRYYENEALVWPLRIYSLSLLIGALNSVQHAKMQREMKFRLMMRCNLIATVVSGLIGVTAAFLGAGLWALVIYYMSNQVVAAVCMMVVQRWHPKWIFSVSRAKEFFGFGWKMLVSSLLYSLYSDIRPLIIGKRYTTADLAYYNKGRQFPQIIATTLDTSVESVMLPVMASAQDSLQQLNKMLRKTISLTMFIVVPAMFGLAAVAKTLIPLLLTNKWNDSIPLMCIFCFTYMNMPMMSANLSVLKAMGRSDVYMKTEMVRRSVMLVVLLITVLCFDSIFIIAAGSAINAWIDAYIVVCATKKLTGIGWLKQLGWIWKTFLAAAIMAVVVWLVNMLPCVAIVKLVLQCITGVIVYLLVSLLLNNDSLIMIRNIVFRKLKERKTKLL